MSQVQATKGLVSILEQNGIKLEGNAQKFQDELKQKEENEHLKIEKNANEIQHTTNPKFGSDLTPEQVYAQKVFDLVPTFSRLLPYFRGNHGTGLPKKLTVPVIGEEKLFKGITERTTGNIYQYDPKEKIATDQVSIEQFGFGSIFGISRELLNYSMIDRLEAIFTDKIARGAARTVDHVILNGDPTDDDTNINTKGTAPSGDEAFMQCKRGGLRKLALLKNRTHDIGTPSFADYVEIAKMLEQYSAEDIFWILNGRTELESIKIEEFKNELYRPVRSQDNGKVINTILGIETHKARDFALADNTGAISSTPADNTKGGVLLAHRGAVQYGFGQALDISEHRNAIKGVDFLASFDFGFEIVDQLADIPTPTVALGFNASV